MNIQTLLTSYPLVSDQVGSSELAVILRELQAVLQRGIDGDVVEFGCYRGTTSLFLRRLLNSEANDRQLHVYDSFAGLPAKSIQDASGAGSQFKAGELATGKKQLLSEFKKAGLAPPVVHKGWFSELGKRDVPAVIAFGFLDGDFYNSIMDSLQLVWPRLHSGGTIVIDDYQRDALPGVERAVRDYFGSSVNVRSEASLGILRKP